MHVQKDLLSLFTRLILDVVKPEELLISPEEAPGHVLDLATSDDPRCWDRPLDRCHDHAFKAGFACFRVEQRR